MYLRARTKEQVDERKKEILDSMDALYLEKEWNDIYLKDVAKQTRISRTAIYSYYKSKEEILLDSLYNHFIKLDDALTSLLDKELSEEELISSISKAFEDNLIILKIMSTNLEDIERSTTLENLVILKTEMKRFQQVFTNLLKKNFPNAKDVEIRSIIICFITMMYGYYPLTAPIDVQKEAMKEVDAVIDISLNELISSSLSLLFNNLK